MFRVLLVGLLAVSMTTRDQPAASLTGAEKADEWRLLFDGTSLNGWRGHKTEAPSPGWKASGGELIREGRGGDIMTVEEFTDFELRLEWKISINGNSGIMFRVGKDGEETWWTGPEFQVLHNAGHADGLSPMTSAGSNYAVHPPAKDVTRPAGEWNSVRIVVKGEHVEHWMNGVKLLEYEIGSPDWEARVNASKFGKIPGYGRVKRGHIALQDHGDLVTYRNIKIKAL